MAQEGLGDTIKWFTVNTGLDKLVGDCKKCEERRKNLNRRVKYRVNKQTT
jgi:hypothetical protein